MERVFKGLDLNRDGTIDFKEWKEFIEAKEVSNYF